MTTTNELPSEPHRKRPVIYLVILTGIFLAMLYGQQSPAFADTIAIDVKTKGPSIMSGTATGLVIRAQGGEVSSAGPGPDIYFIQYTPGTNLVLTKSLKKFHYTEWPSSFGCTEGVLSNRCTLPTWIGSVHETMTVDTRIPFGSALWNGPTTTLEGTMGIKEVRNDLDRRKVGSVVKRKWITTLRCKRIYHVCVQSLPTATIRRSTDNKDITHTMRRVKVIGTGYGAIPDSVWKYKNRRVNGLSYGCSKPRVRWAGATESMKLAVIFLRSGRKLNYYRVTATYTVKLSKFTKKRAQSPCGRALLKSPHSNLKVGRSPILLLKARG